jgi:cytochrome c-550 PedF
MAAEALGVASSVTPVPNWYSARRAAPANPRGTPIAPCESAAITTTGDDTMKRALTICLAAAAIITAFGVRAHGNVTPQGVDTTGLAPLGDKWRDENPYKGNQLALKIGTSAYNQNCARCHGLEAVSGGIAPDLRLLDRDCANIKNATKKAACFKEVDNYYLSSIRAGKVRNGAVYMPPFEGIFNQEAMWAIKTYLETRREAN